MFQILTTSVNTIAVYAPDGKSFEFTDVPVRVTGTLEFGSTTDSMGYTYEYRIKDAKLEPADISDLEEDYKNLHCFNKSRFCRINGKYIYNFI